MFGDGSSTSLWFDRWCDIGTLSALITTYDIFRVGLDFSSKVRDVILNGIWNWPIFLDAIHVLYIVEVSLDKFEWRTGGVPKPFSVSNVWYSIRPRDVKMHTRASSSGPVEPLPEPERTLNRRHHRQNRRVPFNQRNNLPKNPKIVYPPILDINHFRYFLVTLENLYPMDEPMWTADRVVAPTPGFVITIHETANDFAIKGNHLTLVKGNQFDGRTKTGPHKHIHEFLGICDMFKYKDTENEAVRLMMFPLSLTREAKTWLDELNERTIETWDELQTITQEVLNAATGGIFLYKTQNQAYQLLEDKVLLKLNWAKNQKTKSSLKKTITFTDEGSSNANTDEIIA
ncbi:hypothetical protein Tco_0756531 [Tanacetum coccineum]